MVLNWVLYNNRWCLAEYTQKSIEIYRPVSFGKPLSAAQIQKVGPANFICAPPQKAPPNKIVDGDEVFVLRGRVIEPPEKPDVGCWIVRIKGEPQGVSFGDEIEIKDPSWKGRVAGRYDSCVPDRDYKYSLIWLSVPGKYRDRQDADNQRIAVLENLPSYY